MMNCGIYLQVAIALIFGRKEGGLLNVTIKRITVCLCCMSLAAPLIKSVSAAQIVLDNLIPGVGHYVKPLQSIRERKFEHVIEQQTDFSCGAASLASILKYAYNFSDVTEEMVLNGMLEMADMVTIREKGFSLLDMKKYIQSKGLRGRGYRVNAEEVLQLKVPAIVLLNDSGYSHFVVLRRINNEKVYLGDPALGNRIMPFEQFQEKWNNVVFIVIGNQYDRANPLLSPRGALSYKALAPLSPLTDAELLDFGFSFSDIL